MSLWSTIGIKEPTWASNFKNNIINPDTLPNPLKKVQSAGATATITKVENDIKMGFWIIVIILIIGVFARYRR